MKAPLVSVIIVNFNGLHWLKQCIASLAKQRYHPVEIIIVDNASTDGSVAYLKAHYPSLIIIRNNENLGFAESNNIGLEHSKGKYVLFLNNDTVVAPLFITEFMKAFESDNTIGGAQSKLLLLDDPKILDSVGAFMTNTGFLFHYGFHEKESEAFSKPIDLYTAKGASMMFPRRVLDDARVDGWVFDPSYFAYFEETDLCHRIWLAGYRIAYVPTSVIYHKSGGTSTKIDNVTIQYHSFKNRIQSYVSNFGVIKLLQILPVHIILMEGFAFFALVRENLGLFLSLQKALLWNIFKIRYTLAKRKVVQQRIRKVKDKDMWHVISRNPGAPYYLELLKKLHLYQR